MCKKCMCKKVKVTIGNPIVTHIFEVWAKKTQTAIFTWSELRQELIFFDNFKNKSHQELVVQSIAHTFICQKCF